MQTIHDRSPGELSALCSNLAKASEKQFLTEESALFLQLSEYYKGKMALIPEANLGALTDLLQQDLKGHYPAGTTAAKAVEDRGALRAMVWGEKVTMLESFLVDRVAKQGNTVLQNTGVYVCDICGFIFTGDELPEICPICKVPSFKLLPVQRRAT